MPETHLEPTVVRGMPAGLAHALDEKLPSEQPKGVAFARVITHVGLYACHSISSEKRQQLDRMKDVPEVTVSISIINTDKGGQYYRIRPVRISILPQLTSSRAKI
jgi:hypothetical protein